MSCSEQPQPAAKKEPAKAAEPVTGKSALYKMYQKARASWSGDARVLKMNSILVTDVPQVPGKAGAWQATFTSESLGRARTYTYSVVEQEGNLHEGVFGMQEESWSGPAGAASNFDIRAVSSGYRRGLQDGVGKCRRLRQEEPRDDDLVPAGEDPQIRRSGVARDLGRIGRNIQLFGVRERQPGHISREDALRVWSGPPARNAGFPAGVGSKPGLSLRVVAMVARLPADAG